VLVTIVLILAGIALLVFIVPRIRR